MQQEVFFEDLGTRKYKEVWAYQESLLSANSAIKASYRNQNEIPVTEWPTKNHLLFVEHPPVYTLGKNGNAANVLMTTAFMEVEEKLLEGTLEKPLLDIMPENYKLLLQEIERFSLHEIYRYKSVVEIEIAGFHIIGGLLHAFISALMQPQTMKSKNLLLLIPKQFVIDTHPSKTYDSIQSIVDYIAGMTDLYALDLYRKITGINVPELN